MEVNIPQIPQKCTKCGQEMDLWHWARYSGRGPWKGKEQPCSNCGYLINGKKPKIKEINISYINPTFHRGANITSSKKKWHDDIAHRKALPNGDVAIVDDKGNIKEVRPKGTRLRDLK